jgi:putative ATPase
MREMGYGKGYKYAHDYPGHYVPQQNLPPSLRGKKYYYPGDQGYEREVSSQLEERRKKKETKNKFR